MGSRHCDVGLVWGMSGCRVIDGWCWLGVLGQLPILSLYRRDGKLLLESLLDRLGTLWRINYSERVPSNEIHSWICGASAFLCKNSLFLIIYSGVRLCRYWELCISCNYALPGPVGWRDTYDPGCKLRLLYTVQHRTWLWSAVWSQYCPCRCSHQPQRIFHMELASISPQYECPPWLILVYQYHLPESHISPGHICYTDADHSCTHPLSSTAVGCLQAYPARS